MTGMCQRVMVALLPVVLMGCVHGMHPDDVRQISEQLPIRRVILYQNGVGYFEREGKLDGNLLTLHCRPSQINDLLKSLTMIDRGSGRAISVSLPLEKNGANVLSELPKQVRDAAGLLDVLRVFRGARVTVHGKQGTASGRVVGVEPQGVPQPDDKATAQDFRLTLKNSNGALEVYPVSAISRVSLDDRALEVGLDRSLDVSLDDGAWKPVTLTVRLAGKETHELLVSYIVEMPNWKPAYRLVLTSERQPLLQGWAVVDNMSGESWVDARLSLVAGTPMSFIYDLHAPRFTRRVDLTPRGAHTALAPTTEEPGYAEDGDASEVKDTLQRTYARRRAAGETTRGPSNEPTTPKADEAKPLMYDKSRTSTGTTSLDNITLERQLRTRVKGQKVGSLFRYDLKDPVTVPDSSSTLVNIVNSRVPGAEVVLFRPELTAGQDASHPYRAVRFTNDSGFTLEKGPVTIYSGGTFVGEGFLERMEKASTIFLTFSIDGNVSMKRRREHAQEVLRMLKIARGQIESEVLYVDRQVYDVVNHHERPITAYVKSAPPSSSYKLRGAPKNTVITPGASYVPVTVAPGKSAKLAIEWVSPSRRWLAVDTSMATTVLKLFSSSGKIPASIKPTIDKILAAKQRIAEIAEEIARVSRTKSELSADQDRVRANLDLLRKVKGNAALRARLTRNLGTLEEQLGRLTSRYVKLDEEKATLEGTIRALIGEINFDASN